MYVLAPVGKEHNDSMLLEGRRGAFSGERSFEKWSIMVCRVFINKTVSKQEVPPTCKVESVFLRGHVPVIPGLLMNTLPLRFSFPFESTERPRLKMDLHFFDFPDNFLLIEKKKKSVNLKPAAGEYVHVAVFSLAVNVDDSVVECGGAGVRQTVLPLTLSMHGMVGAQGAGLGLFQAHQFHRSTLTTYGKCGVLLCTHQTST